MINSDADIDVDISRDADPSVTMESSESIGTETVQNCVEEHLRKKNENLVRNIFLLLGIGFLLPWNAIISASNYFENRTNACSDDRSHYMYINMNMDVESKLDTVARTISSTAKNNEHRNMGEHVGGNSAGGGNNFMLWFGLVYNFSGVITLACMLLFQKIGDGKESVESSGSNEGIGTLVSDTCLEDSSSPVMPAPSAIEQDSQSSSDSGSEEPITSLIPTMPSAAIRNSSRKDAHQNNNQWTKVVTALTCFLLTMLLTTTLVLLPSTIVPPILFQSISLISAAICGIAGAFISTGIVAFASDFPPRLGIQPFVTGQALGGVAISILNFISFAIESSGVDVFWEDHCSIQDPYEHEIGLEQAGVSETDRLMSDILQPFVHLTTNTKTKSVRHCEAYRTDWGAFCYFLIGTIFIAVCISLYIYLDQAEVTEYYRSRRRMGTRHEGADSGAVLACDDERNIEQRSVDNIFVESQEHNLIEPLLGSSQEEECEIHGNNQTLERENRDMAEFVWKRMRSLATVIFSTFLITLIVFPSWTTKIESVLECQDRRSRLRNDLFVPGFIVLFNVFDFIGRNTSGYVRLSLSDTADVSKSLTIASCARIIFLPLFLLCKTSHGVPLKLLSSDWFPVVLTAAFAFSNGFLSTLSFMQAAIRTPTGENMQQIASTIVNFAVGIGLVSGSLLSFLYNFLGTTYMNGETN